MDKKKLVVQLFNLSLLYPQMTWSLIKIIINELSTDKSIWSSINIVQIKKLKNNWLEKGSVT